MGVGQRVAELREAAGLSQAELARRTGISRPHICRLEGGFNDNITAEAAVKLAEVLRTTTDYLLMGRREALGDTTPVPTSEFTPSNGAGGERRTALRQSYQAFVQVAPELDEVTARWIDREAARFIKEMAERHRQLIAMAQRERALAGSDGQERQGSVNPS